MRPSAQRRTTFRIATAAIVVAFACLLALASTALAVSPHRLAGPITDDVDALSGNTSEVQTALNDLQDKTGTQLWVWFTNTLDGAQSSSFATETARQSALGSTDLLLVIALGDHEYGYWKGDNVKITDGDLEQILSQDLESGLRAEDYPGAIVGTAKALMDAMSGGPVVVPEKTVPPDDGGVITTPIGGTSDDSRGGGSLGILLSVVGILLLIFAVWWILRVRQRSAVPSATDAKPGGPNADLAAMTPKDLDEEAMAKGMAEVASSSLDAQFAGLDDEAEDIDAENRLAALKKGS